MNQLNNALKNSKLFQSFASGRLADLFASAQFWQMHATVVPPTDLHKLRQKVNKLKHQMNRNWLWSVNPVL
jgi:hypothetical protein